MSLKRLSELFGDTTLYIVGGAVRNMLLGVPAKDIDITASMRADDVIELLRDTDFEVVPSSLRMGTLIIKGDGEKYEYTSFRSDSYPLNSGVHAPLDVTFTDDINVDARRRDFTCNAVYYDIMREVYVDPLGGIADIERRVLRTTRAPELVFAEDGLRLMRLVRFMAETGFDIDPECYRVASGLCYLLEDISVERITEEFNKILVADTSGYGNVDGHYYGVKALVDMGLMDYIIPELMHGKGVMQNPKYHKDDVLSHEIEAMRVADSDIRLLALIHDVGKPYEMDKSGNMHAHNVSGSIIAREVLTRLRYPTKVIADTTRLVYIHMFDTDNSAKDSTIKKFILDNYEYMDTFLRMRYADITASCAGMESYYHIKAVYESMLAEGVPMTLKALAVSGNDLVELGYKGKDIGIMLERIHRDVAITGVPNDRDILREYIRGGRWKL